MGLDTPEDGVGHVPSTFGQLFVAINCLKSTFVAQQATESSSALLVDDLNGIAVKGSEKLVQK